MHACMHTHTYVRTYIHACMHTCIHTYTHKRAHTCTRAHVHTCIPAYMHTCIRAYVHTCIRAHALARYGIGHALKAMVWHDWGAAATQPGVETVYVAPRSRCQGDTGRVVRLPGHEPTGRSAYARARPRARTRTAMRARVRTAWPDRAAAVMCLWSQAATGRGGPAA